MAEKVEETSSLTADNDNTCVVCFKQAFIYSIGCCNHKCCYECSSRMRVLCERQECVTCRQDLPKVIFTKTIQPFANLDRELRSGLYEKKYRIAFADLEIQKCFYKLLENQCPECNHTPFLEFGKLKEHVRKVHELFYCEICTDNLKIFSSERRCYSRSQLATHRRVGDVDDKSHKGHPSCTYCELRFLDKDELFRHLRKEHYFCHLCDADGVNLFYGALIEMRDHFKTKHYLCEEDECAEEQFTAVFRSEIDLRAHQCVEHSRGMTRMQEKQARTLDLEFAYAPRNSARGGNESSRGNRSRRNDVPRDAEREQEPAIVQQPMVKIDSKNEEQFPSLGGPGPSVQLSNTVRHITYGTSGLARTKENFPSLSGAPVSEKPKPTNQGGKQYKMPSASSLLKNPSASSSKKSNNKGQGMSAKSNGSLKTVSSDFPALSQSTTTSNWATSNFSSISTPKPTSSSNRIATSVASNHVVKKTADFPVLSLSTPKKKRNKNQELLEDMIETERNVNLNVNLKNHHQHIDYVSLASQVSKVQTVQQKDIQTAPVEMIRKNVPKLNSADNFPTLGSSKNQSEASSAPEWLTAGNIQKLRTKQGKKVNEMPNRDPPKLQNGYESKKKTDSQINPAKGAEKSKPTISNNKENKNDTLEKPPPGFVKTKPPPGFQTKQDNVKSVAADYIYLPPPNASKRNQGLILEFQKALKSPESLQEFRQKSQMYRDGEYFAKSYYDTCKLVLGASFDSIFPELLTMLPDIEKQQGLFVVHLKENTGGKSKKDKIGLEACSMCKQVLLSQDLHIHEQSHALQNNFPLLSSSETSESVKQWKK